jgi:hypothetical protein
MGSALDVGPPPDRALGHGLPVAGDGIAWAPELVESETDHPMCGRLDPGVVALFQELAGSGQYRVGIAMAGFGQLTELGERFRRRHVAGSYTFVYLGAPP